MTGGRKLTAEQVATSLRDSRGLVSVAARHLGTSRANIYRYRDRHESVRAALEDAREERVDNAESKLDTAIERGEPWAVAMTLRTLGRARGYGERLEHTGPGGGPIAHEHRADALKALLADGESFALLSRLSDRLAALEAPSEARP